MKATHLTEEEIQQYVLDSSANDMEITEHANSCEGCKASIKDYQLLFAGIKQQPRGAFDFNLAELVVAQLPSPGARLASDNFFVYLFVLAALIVGGVALYYFRNFIAGLFTSIVPLFIYLTVTTVVTLSIILSFDMYKIYQTKMKSLDFP